METESETGHKIDAYVMRKPCRHVSRIVIQQVFMMAILLLLKVLCVLLELLSSNSLILLSIFCFVVVQFTHFISIKSHNKVSCMFAVVFLLFLRKCRAFKCRNIVKPHVRYFIRLLTIIS